MAANPSVLRASRLERRYFTRLRNYRRVSPKRASCPPHATYRVLNSTKRGSGNPRANPVFFVLEDPFEVHDVISNHYRDNRRYYLSNFPPTTGLINFIEKPKIGRDMISPLPSSSPFEDEEWRSYLCDNRSVKMYTAEISFSSNRRRFSSRVCLVKQETRVAHN